MPTSGQNANQQQPSEYSPNLKSNNTGMDYFLRMTHKQVVPATMHHKRC
uniref:Putative L-ascorbate peroxidase 2 n=1 Tax=Festuca arundinacea TaxID=4606 RepID=A0A6G7SJ21_FESAR|nr:putative L-ascorbate peroxidase 2 [Lolium arundinaceum]